MNTSTNSDFRTNLADYLNDLLNFVEEKTHEAQRDPTSRAAALSEAMGAFPIIKERLYQEDQVTLTKLMLIGFFDEDLRLLATLSEDALAGKIANLCERHAAVRSILDDPANFAT